MRAKNQQQCLQLRKGGWGGAWLNPNTVKTDGQDRTIRIFPESWDLCWIFILKVFFFNCWTMVDLQCCVNFYYTAKLYNIHILFHYGLSQDIKYSPLCYIVREGNGTPLQYSCLENPLDGGAWWAAVHGLARSQTRLSDFPFTFHFHALEKEMATHSSVRAWRIPGTGEPGGLLSMGSHRIGHDWSDLAAAAAVLYSRPYCLSILYIISVVCIY